MKRFVSILLFASAIVDVKAQTMTFNHDDVVMNQFTVGEVGLGHLGGNNPFAREWYYLLYRSYQNSAMATNKQLFRTQMQLVLNREVSYAEALDSALTNRKRVEFSNIADRTPGDTDLAWQAEKGKIEDKLAIFKSNIERLTREGAPSREYITWMERYNCINCGLQAVRDAYMPQGKRKEQYLAIYKDILLKNTEICEYIMYLRSMKTIKNMSGNATPLRKSKVGLIARTAHGRWKIAMAAGSGGVDKSK